MPAEPQILLEASVLARSLEGRMPWLPAQRALKAEGLPRGRGWKNAVAGLSTPGTLTVQQTASLQQILIEHQLCGEKLVRIYHIDPAVKASIIDRLREHDVEPNRFSSCFPATLSTGEIEESFPEPLRPAAVFEVETGMVAVFASTKGIVYREEVNREELPAHVQEALADYDAVLGVRQQKRQTLDVVHVPFHGELIDVRVDFPDGMLRSAAQSAQAQVRRAFNAMVGEEVLQVPLNLFGLIDSMYNAEDEGVLVELAFGTTTASTKIEKMRRRHLCLRQEAYHMGGRQALEAPVEPFKISIEWSVALGRDAVAKPELTLHSTQAVRDSETPVLREIVVRNSSGALDYNFVMSRVEHYMADLLAPAVLEPEDATG